MCVAKVSACVAYRYASLIFWARKQTASIVSSLSSRANSGEYLEQKNVKARLLYTKS